MLSWNIQLQLLRRQRRYTYSLDFFDFQLIDMYPETIYYYVKPLNARAIHSNIILYYNVLARRNGREVCVLSLYNIIPRYMRSIINECLCVYSSDSDRLEVCVCVCVCIWYLPILYSIILVTA